jgi:DNA gyrase subunit A
LEKKYSLLIISSNGYGKRTEIGEYKIQKRGGSGIKTANVTPKTGNIISGMIVDEETEELVAMSQKSQVIRTDVKEIPLLGRSTQGVRIMKLRDKDAIASLICL